MSKGLVKSGTPRDSKGLERGFKGSKKLGTQNDDSSGTQKGLERDLIGICQVRDSKRTPQGLKEDM